MGSEELILVRHAHAERDAASGRDVDRPLSTLGFSQAQAAAGWMRERQMRPAKVLCSPSLRTRQTLSALQMQQPDLELIDEPGIYEATPGELITLIDRHRPASPLVVVGHNPGLETLVTLLADGRSTDGRGMPTGAIARLRLRSSGPLEPGCAELVEFWWP
ncbi:MAG: histidine phosphatase family protein [Rhodanobacteraceae bacterium]|nr:histidine phosphatase family protein [Rhodanobacteraceae bacterium]